MSKKQIEAFIISKTIFKCKTQIVFENLLQQ